MRDAGRFSAVLTARWAASSGGRWVSVHCVCGRSACVPHKLLTKRYGATARAPALLARFQCGTCWRRPALAQRMDSAAGGPQLNPPFRRVPLALAWQCGPGAIN